MNNGNFMARMTKDFESNQSGKSGLGSIAIDRPYPFDKDQDGKKITDFLTIKVIGEKNVNRAKQYLTKGTKIVFSGIVCRDTYKDKDGNHKEFNYIMVSTWEFAESKGSGNTNNNSSAPDTSASSTDDFLNIPDNIGEELPFN